MFESISMTQSTVTLPFDQADNGWAVTESRSRVLCISLNLNVFDLDPVDIDDAPAHPDPPVETVCHTFIDEAKPPAQAVIVARDRSSSTGLDCSDMESR